MIHVAFMLHVLSDHNWPLAPRKEFLSEAQSGCCGVTVATDVVVSSGRPPETPLERWQLGQCFNFGGAAAESFVVGLDALWTHAVVIVADLLKDAHPELDGKVHVVRHVDGDSAGVTVCRKVGQIGGLMVCVSVTEVE